MSDDDDGPCTDCGDTGITYQTERRCSCLPPMNAPSEERVMRAREVLAETAHAEGCNFLSRAMADCDCDRPIRAMLAFSDEGSGIGELREGFALVPIEPTKSMIAAGDEDAGGWATAADIWRAMLAASPDIDHAGSGTNAK